MLVDFLVRHAIDAVIRAFTRAGLPVGEVCGVNERTDFVGADQPAIAGSLIEQITDFRKNERAIIAVKSEIQAAFIFVLRPGVAVVYSRLEIELGNGLDQKTHRRRGHRVNRRVRQVRADERERTKKFR